MGCGMGRVQSAKCEKEVVMKEHPLLWLCCRENHIKESPISDYDPKSQVTQYNVVLNGILFQVINPIEDVEQVVNDHINSEIE